MKKEGITLKEAIERVKGLFEVTDFKNKEEGKSFFIEKEDGTTTFFFDKRQYMRYEVITKLIEFFDNVFITDGQCRITSITLLWTQVHLEHVDDKTKK